MVVYIFQSEINAIINQASKRGFESTETGGDLFGYWNIYGEPIIALVGGPGPNARCFSAEFEQDYKYVLNCERLLLEQYGLLYLGDWHSHHNLGIAQPSKGDINRIYSLFDKNQRSFMTEIIVNHRQNGELLSAFYYDRNISEPIRIEFKILENPVSPIRESLNRNNQISMNINILSSNSNNVRPILFSSNTVESGENKKDTKRDKIYNIDNEGNTMGNDTHLNWFARLFKDIFD